MDTNMLDLLSLLSVPSMLGVLGIIVAWLAERRHRQKDHDQRIKWRTQTDDRLNKLESDQKAGEERLTTRINNQQARIDDRWSNIEKELGEQSAHLKTLQEDVKSIQLFLAEIKGTLKRIEQHGDKS